MTDMVSKEHRSRIMARIRSQDTMPEMAVRRLLHRMGYRFRLHDSRLPGKPDIVLPKHRTVFLVHGCFWHGHSCQEGRRPKSNTEYWNKKLDRNTQRDHKNRRLLRKERWDPIVIWECQCGNEMKLRRIVSKALGHKDSDG